MPARVSEPLDAFESAHLSQDFESASAVSGGGEVLLEKDGETNHVQFTNDEVNSLRGADVVFTHNHPSGRGLSFDDVNFARDIDAAEMRAVGRGGGGRGSQAYIYRAQPGSSGLWPAAGDLKTWYDEVGARVFDALLSKVDAGALTTGEAGREHYHEIWKTIAAEHPESLKYAREERKGA